MLDQRGYVRPEPEAKGNRDNDVKELSPFHRSLVRRFDDLVLGVDDFRRLDHEPKDTPAYSVRLDRATALGLVERGVMSLSRFIAIYGA